MYNRICSISSGFATRRTFTFLACNLPNFPYCLGWMCSSSQVCAAIIPLSAAKVGSCLTYFQSKVVNLTYFQSKVIYFQSKVIYFQCKPRLEKFWGAGGQKGAVLLGRNTEIQSRNTRNTPKYRSRVHFKI